MNNISFGITGFFRRTCFSFFSFSTFLFFVPFPFSFNASSLFVFAYTHKQAHTNVHVHRQTGTITGAFSLPPLTILHYYNIFFFFHSIGNNLASISNILDIK